MTMSAASESCSIGRTAGVVASLPSQVRCFSGFCTDNRGEHQSIYAPVQRFGDLVPIGPSPATATRKLAPGLFDKFDMGWLLYLRMTAP